MARYIDANAFQEKLAEVAREPDYRHEGEDWSCGVCLAGTHLDGFPTADVVPRSEVEKLESVIDALKDSNEHLAVFLEEKKADVAREIFEEVNSIFQNQFEKCSKESELKLLEPFRQCERFAINELWSEVAKLKKKYTEGERDGS